MLLSLMSQSMSYRPEQSRTIMNNDLEKSTDMHISRTREEEVLLCKPMHQSIDQGTRSTSTQRDEFLSSGTGKASHPRSSSSASLAHRHTDIESGSSSLDWSSNYKIPTVDDSKFCPSSASSNCASSGASELAANILLQFGLEKQDLDYLISLPEDQITLDNLPLILHQIHIQKAKSATTAVQSVPYPEPQPNRSVGTGMCREETAVLQPSKVIDYGRSTSSRSRFHSPLYDRPTFSRYRSHSRNPDRQTSQRMRDEKQSSPRRNDDRQAFPRSSRERRSPPWRNHERQSPTMGSSPRRKKSSSSEMLNAPVFKQSDLEAGVKALVPTLWDELHKMNTPSSSSSSSKGTCSSRGTEPGPSALSSSNPHLGAEPMAISESDRKGTPHCPDQRVEVTKKIVFLQFLDYDNNRIQHRCYPDHKIWSRICWCREGEIPERRDGKLPSVSVWNWNTGPGILRQSQLLCTQYPPEHHRMNRLRCALQIYQHPRGAWCLIDCIDRNEVLIRQYVLTPNPAMFQSQSESVDCWREGLSDFPSRQYPFFAREGVVRMRSVKKGTQVLVLGGPS
ncbi:uncharacterized protein LOC123979739 [Micropterus dolomieu]|uniref:uncharacterized protein LOC123979739 n=1 Tax=Micropterus dolomieu TaxID=147949 RepID=UPI001E8EB173|nr:uncharacterized protein LOC123979739 [Micropterus dolomieu]XP_045919715.1 uncharacterized protein LOC123979739 [Micropterus dolomieu]XP_045919716.1 uncharacterized protein LOC123979739 [Micropterus dolomieu]XP_045919718.1 uncharacterized protein LOC123979739 [Micropterus dolomieu]